MQFCEVVSGTWTCPSYHLGETRTYRCVLDFSPFTIGEDVISVSVPLRYSRLSAGRPADIYVTKNGVEIWREPTLYNNWMDANLSFNARNGDVIEVFIVGRKLYYGSQVAVHNQTVEQYSYPPIPEVPEYAISLLFWWIAAGFTEIAGWFFGLADSVRVIPLLGDPIADFFAWIGTKLESIENWLYVVGSWADEVMVLLAVAASSVTELITAVLDLQNWRLLASGILTELQELQTNLSSKVFDVLGSTWGNLVSMLQNFNGWVFAALGSTWDSLLSMLKNFNGWVFAALGSTWDKLTDMYANFPSWVKSSLGDDWTWLMNLKSNFEQSVRDIILGGYNNLEEWISVSLVGIYAELMAKVKESVTELLDALVESVDEWIDARVDKLKEFVEKILMKF